MAEPYEHGKTFVILGNDGATNPVTVTDSFWPDLVSGKLGDGRLVSAYEFDGAWDSWEVHPNGDEIVLLISGSVEMTLENPDGERDSVSMSTPGQFVIVPRGTWHTATAAEKGTRMFFITDGEGTENRPA